MEIQTAEPARGDSPSDTRNTVVPELSSIADPNAAADTSVECDRNSTLESPNGTENEAEPIVNPKPKGFKCPICDKQFVDRYDLRRHGVVHTKERPYLCERCPRSFTQMSSLTKHMLIHERAKDFQCAHCPMRFIQKINMATHLKQVHFPSDDPAMRKRFLCQKCPSSFKKVGWLENHRARIHGEMVMLDRWIKPTSNAPSRSQTSGEDTETTENDDDESADPKQTAPDVESDIVVKIVPSRRTEHMAGKTKQRPYGCSICPAAFKKAAYLSQHMTSHLGMHPYRCDICDKTFSRKQSFNSHTKLHSQSTRQFQCTKCEETFNRWGTLKRHTMLHEEWTDSFRCPYCQKSFRWLQNCRTHIKNFHLKEVSNHGALLQPIQKRAATVPTSPTDSLDQS